MSAESVYRPRNVLQDKTEKIGLFVWRGGEKENG